MQTNLEPVSAYEQAELRDAEKCLRGVKLLPETVTTPNVLTALVVQPELADALFFMRDLAACGFQVTVADFRTAKTRLGSGPPDLLVVEICLGEYNGLHLLIRGLSAAPRMAAVVTCGYEDVVLQRETELHGGVFVVKPISSREFLAAASRAVWRSAENTSVIRAPYERRRSERRNDGPAYTGFDRRLLNRRRLPISVSS